MAERQKLVPLEGLRGIAAAIVVLYHLVLGFTPRGVGAVPHGHGWLDLGLQFLLGCLNGGAAVAIFFVLSGFILSLPFGRDRRLSRILVAGLKRWPRLAALTTIACLFAWALITWSGHDYKTAARVIGSGWMATHGNAPLAGHHLTWWNALWEGFCAVFTSGDVHFDSPLWTMRIELFGSFAVFLAAPILFALQSWALRLSLTGLAMALAGGTYPITYLSDFLVGVILAMLYTEDRLPHLRNWQAAILGFIGLYLFSFTYEQKFLIDAPIKAIMPPGDTSHYVWDAGAVLIILVLLGNPLLRRLFSGSWAIWLGLLSFPIYLLHGPIMLSAGAASFLTGLNRFGMAGAAIMAALISVALTLLCALPLVWVDKYWTAILGRIMAPFTKKPPYQKHCHCEPATRESASSRFPASPAWQSSPSVTQNKFLVLCTSVNSQIVKLKDWIATRAPDEGAKGRLHPACARNDDVSVPVPYRDAEGGLPPAPKRPEVQADPLF